MMALVPGGSKSPRRDKQTPQSAAIDNHAEIDTPPDFSFMHITDFLGEFGRKGQFLLSLFEFIVKIKF